MNTDTSLRKITPSVIAFHLLFILLAMYYAAPPEIKPQPRKLLVSTVQLQPKKREEKRPISQEQVVVEAPAAQQLPQVKQEEAKVEPSPPPPSPAPPKAKPKPEPKPQPKPKPKPKPQNKPAQAKKTVPPKPPTTKPAENKSKINDQQIALLNKAKEKIGQINTKNDKMSNSNIALAIPTLAIDSLEIDAAPTMTSQEISYRDELARRLKLQLKLPQAGSIKIRLTLTREGKVKKVQILAGENKLNKEHVEKALPNLTFPPFGSQFNGAPEYTFTINMSSDD